MKIIRIPLLVLALLPAAACGKKEAKRQDFAAVPPQVPIIALPMHLSRGNLLNFAPRADTVGCQRGEALRLDAPQYSDSLNAAFKTTDVETFLVPTPLPGSEHGWVYGIWRLDAKNTGGQWIPKDTTPRLVAFAAKVKKDTTLVLEELVVTRGKGFSLENKWKWASVSGEFTCMPPVLPDEIFAGLGTPKPKKGGAK